MHSEFIRAVVSVELALKVDNIFVRFKHEKILKGGVV